MNRQQKREYRKAYVRKVKKQFGLNTQQAKELLAAIESGKIKLPDPDLADGSRVRLDVERITSRKAYPEMQQAYRDFVERNASTTFTARLDRTYVAHFEEDPTWQFWTGDLILVKEGEAEE